MEYRGTIRVTNDGHGRAANFMARSAAVRLSTVLITISFTHARGRLHLATHARKRRVSKMFRKTIAPNATFATVKALSISSLAFGLGLLCCTAQADIYKWVDEDGITHYSERKPGKQLPVEIIAREPSAEVEAEPENKPEAAAIVNQPAPPPEPKICDGETGATAVGALAMLLNRAYIASIPDFVADNAAVFASEQFYVCLDAIFASALQHEQLTGEEASDADPRNAPLAVLLETAPDLADAFRALLIDRAAESWRTIQQRLLARRPRLAADTDSLTRLIRSVIVDAQTAARIAQRQAGTR